MQTRSLSKTPFKLGRIGLVLGLTLTLTACEEGGEFALFKPKPKDEAAASVKPAAGQKTVERDVEAPDVFQVSEAGLWDGRPSLGGVWVAHPDVKEPERVIIRNTANNKFVVGALFRRERANPGPRLQLSSDAAEALGMIAGQPMEINVTALRKEQVAVEGGGQGLSEPEFVEETSLDPIKSAAAAIEAADTATPAPVAAAPKPAAPKTSSLSKPYVQLGIFSIEKNANNTATAMRTAGMIPTVKKQSLNGKTFWRVIVGPAQSRSDLNQLIKRVKSSGFTDAYAVSN